MGKQFKFLDKTTHQSNDDIPDENIWWHDREVEEALERAGEEIRQAQNPFTEVLRDRTTINRRDLMSVTNPMEYVEHIKTQQANRLMQALIQENYIDFELTNDEEGNFVFQAKLKVQRIN